LQKMKMEISVFSWKTVFKKGIVMSKSIEIIIDKNGNVSLDLKNIPNDEHSITRKIEESLGTVVEKVYKENEVTASVSETVKAKN